MASKVYNKVVRILCEVAERTRGETISAGSGSPTERFEQVVRQIEAMLRTEADRRSFAEMLDVDPRSSFEEMATELLEVEADGNRVGDVDELTPAAIKDALYRVAHGHGRPRERVDLPLPIMLREALKIVFTEDGFIGRINVGGNRHFPRLLQYVRECELETWWSDTDRGLRLRNATGRGRVADAPNHPNKLKVVIDKDQL